MSKGNEKGKGAAKKEELFESSASAVNAISGSAEEAKFQAELESHQLFLADLNEQIQDLEEQIDEVCPRKA